RDRSVGRVGGVRLDAEGELVRAGVLDREVVAGRRDGVVGDRQVATGLRLVAGGIDGGDAVREVGCVVEGDRGHAGAGAARAVVEVAGQHGAVVVVGLDVAEGVV